MTRRGWTAQEIEDAVERGQSYPAENRVNPGHGATRHVNSETGRYVVIDDTTGQVIQLSGDKFKIYPKAPSQ